MKKYYFLLALFLSTAIVSNAQNFAWAKSAGGTDVDVTQSIAADAAGNTFAAGYFRSTSITFGSCTLTNPDTSNRMFIVKYDPSGTVLWAKSAIGSYRNEADAVTIDPSGNVFVTGTYENTMTADTYTINSIAGGSDMFLAKYDNNGNAVWLKSAGGSDVEFPRSLVCDASGNIFVTGEFSSSPMVMGSFSLTNSGAFDIFIAKYDAGGTVMWASSKGTAMYEGALAITADAAGNVFIGGYYENPTLIFGTDTIHNNDSPYHGVFIAKYNNAGIVQWAKGTGGGGELKSLTASGSDVYATGYYTDSISFGSTSFTSIHYYFDAFIAKYDSGGNVVWAKKEGGAYDDLAYSITSDAMSNIYVTGSFNGPSSIFGGTTLTNAGGTDIFIVKYDLDGTPLWSESAGGDQDDESFAVVCNATDAFISGEFNSSAMNAGPYALSNAGNMDMYIAKLSPDVATETTSLTNISGAAVFPNPSTGLITINSDYPADAAISIYDMVGKCMYENTVQKNSNRSLDLSVLPKGVYFMKIISAEKKEVKKIVLE